jgi:two-component system, OmpR family, KDP operon response regulator KdpE
MSPKRTRILVIDDDAEILRLVRRVLELEGFDVVTVESGEAAIREMELEQFDLLVLDLMLPGIDGITTGTHIRNFSTLPIIVLTAKTSVEEKVKALEACADDYITKPFSTQELVARVRAALRRSQMTLPTPSTPRILSGNLEIDFRDRRVTVGGQEVKLTPTEFNLLQELALHSGKVLTHSHLLNRIWGGEYRDELRYLHVFVNRLRNKLMLHEENQRMIENISGIGYRFTIL